MWTGIDDRDSEADEGRPTERPEGPVHATAVTRREHTMSEDTTHRGDGEDGGSPNGAFGRGLAAASQVVARIGHGIARVGALLNPATMGSRARAVRDGTLQGGALRDGTLRGDLWSRARSLDWGAVASRLRLPAVVAGGRSAWDRTPAMLRGALFGLLAIVLVAIVTGAVVDGPVK